MSDCRAIDPLVTRFVDGDLEADGRAAVTAHLERCPVCRSRVAAEESVRALLRERRTSLAGPCAPQGLRAACAAHVLTERRDPVTVQRSAPPAAWRRHLAPFAAAAALLLVVGGAFLYQATERSSRLLAAELATDHMKCQAMNAVLGLAHTPHVVEQSMASGFGWQMRVPAARDLELVGSRPCLYARGKIAHIMYRHRGEPVSLYMLPRTEHAETVVGALGYECAIWSEHDRTYVLVAREPRAEIERLAGVMQAALR
jgi:anti-sigma factor RsiW